MAENDIFYRQHDLSQNSTMSSEETMTTATNNINNVPPGNPAATYSAMASLSPTLAGPSSVVSSSLTTTANTMPCSALGSTVTVDIMEDEEENEQQRLRDCPHGTPSRVPLIGESQHHAHHQQHHQYHENQQQQQQNYKDKSTRGLSLNSSHTGSLPHHGHVLQTFHRGHSLRRNCHVHSSGGPHQAQAQTQQQQGRQQQSSQTNAKTKSQSFLFSRSKKSKNDSEGGGGGGGGGIGNVTSDEDGDHDEATSAEVYSQKGSEEFILEPLHYSRKPNKSKKYSKSFSDDENMEGPCICSCAKDEAQNDDINDDDEDDATSCQLRKSPQVPIYLVLLILLCYICVGTVIFAFWENWSLIDGAYFCFVTLTTIGYGDFIPIQTFNGPDVQLFACCAYLILGLVLVAMFFNILETKLMWKCRRIAVRLKLAQH